jgi:hypothetical protein
VELLWLYIDRHSEGSPDFEIFARWWLERTVKHVKANQCEVFLDLGAAALNTNTSNRTKQTGVRDSFLFISSMAPRLSKRQQRELEELEALGGPSNIQVSSGDEAPIVAKLGLAGFSSVRFSTFPVATDLHEEFASFLMRKV